MMRGTISAATLAAIAGAVIWTATMIAAGRREPWDAGFYWTLSYPVAVLGSGLLGYLFPERPWRWAVILMLMQMMVMIAAGSDFSLLPLGLVMLAVLSVPPAIAGTLAAKLRG
ncbi:MAG TPA: hypothetical protein VFI23_06425 [Rhizomicrobium sp.]|nr:hypothetical protein [Rhizomicrobium sp.]